MASEFEYHPLSNSKEQEQLKEIVAQCFGSTPADSEYYFKLIGSNNFRLLCQSGQVIGGLAIYSMGQWYGGQSVPMKGIAAVSVAPEYRGKGAAYQLMKYALQEIHSLGIPISVLYAATQALYRKVGYEQGGSYCRWELDTAKINVRERNLSMQRINTDEYEIFERLYAQQARINNGNLVRPQAIWSRIIKPPQEQKIYAYVIGSVREPEGYVLFAQNDTSEGLSIDIKDWTILTTAAALSFWTFLADHRSQVQQVQWRGSPIEEKLLFLPEQTAKITSKTYWLLRIIDVSVALSQRGYPLGVEVELHLEVKDDFFPDNNGKFCLKVSRGRGEVFKGGKGELQLDVRGLASLYTGLFTPVQLKLVGYLQSTKEALTIATLLFSGSEPWMPDFF
ncbi:GNAT family N-acetyltransferase [Pleurocapsales cyanobacterium LEGE 06147]|nr:GNAT family N-acetyltransferase [Pleurocapsales cyanobacterium LEGE 06147]